jgi:hypothetical protein
VRTFRGESLTQRIVDSVVTGSRIGGATIWIML